MNAIEVKDLHYRYADGTPALRGVSFAIERGQSVGIIGPNGAGKSTLLLHLNGLLPETIDGTSSVTIDGLPVVRANLAEVRRRVGLVFQDADDQIFCASVREDVAFGPEQLALSRPAVDERVRDALAKVGLAGFEARAPHRLSGGEKRRVCLAGVLACGPSVLALDEPTMGLDPRGRREFKALLKSIDATKVIATHDLEMVVELCERTMVLDGGAIVADGTTVELLNDEALMLAHGLERPHVLLHRHPHEKRDSAAPHLSM